MTLLRSERNNFSHSFLYRPDIHFASQHAKEQVVLVVRQHPITQFSWVVNIALFLVVLFFANVFFIGMIPAGFAVIVNIFTLVFVFSYAWINILLWYFTVGIITNERIIDLDFYNILYKEFAATSIVQVSEISMRVGGFIGSIFNYGNVYVKTQGFAQNIEFDNVPLPARVVKVINELMPKPPERIIAEG